MNRRSFIAGICAAPAIVPLAKMGSPNLDELRRIVRSESFIPAQLAEIYGDENVTRAMWGRL